MAFRSTLLVAGVVVLLLACHVQADFSFEAEGDWRLTVPDMGRNFLSGANNLLSQLQVDTSDQEVTNTWETDPNNNVPIEAGAEFWNNMLYGIYTPWQQFMTNVPSTATTGTFPDLMQSLVSSLSDGFMGMAGNRANFTDAGSVQLGGGIGAGFQVYDCEGNIILDFGMGMGFGMTMAQGSAMSITGGFGGGGGLQLYKNGGLFYSVGGGGGGPFSFTSAGFNPPSGSFSEDADETMPTDFHTAITMVAQSSCQPMLVSLGGGAGAGFDISGSQPMHFGAGYGFGNGVNPPQGSNATDPVMSIVNSCTSSCVSSGQGYNACFCPCFQNGALAAGLAWAAQIQCSED